MERLLNDSHGRTICIAGAHRDNGKRLVGTPMKSWLRFWNYRPRFIVDLSSDGKLLVAPHVLPSNQIRIGHATAWMRTRVCASFMLRPYFLSDLHRRLRASFAEKPNDAPSSLMFEASRAGTVNDAMALGIELSSSLLKKKHRHSSAEIHWEIIADKSQQGWLELWLCLSPGFQRANVWLGPGFIRSALS